MLGGLADGTGFSADEIESFTVDRVRFWWRNLMAFRQAVKEASG